MGLHEELLKQLQTSIEEGIKLDKIRTLTSDLINIREQLKKENEILLVKNEKGDELNGEEEARIKALNNQYNSSMKMVRELIIR
jgi:hypothetical protein